MQLLPFVSLALALLCSASPFNSGTTFSPIPLSSFGPHVEKHAWSETPSDWIHVGPAPDNHKIRLRIALKQAKFDDLVRQLYEISDPNHDRYGQHLSKEDVEQLVKPDEESVLLVENWLAAHQLDVDISERTPAGDWVSIVVSVRLAEQMLDAQYGVYQHKHDSSNQIVRTLSYSLPQHLHGHVDVITPTTMFGSMRPMKVTSFIEPSVPLEPAALSNGHTKGQCGFEVPDSCNYQVTPSCLMALYGTQGYVPKATGKNSIGIAGYLDQYAIYSDLNVSFFSDLFHHHQIFCSAFYRRLSSGRRERHVLRRTIQWRW